jgi:class 3 adenylate cyclase/HAMP domain-containing protein
MNSSTERPFQLSLRWRITLPFLLLALALALGGAYFVLRLLRETGEERFLRQLANSGQLASDAVVRIEGELLELERLVANTEGVSEAVLADDAEDLRLRILPLVVNAGADSVAVLDDEAQSLLSIRRQFSEGQASYETVRGERFYAEWDLVLGILSPEQVEDEAEKHAGMGVLEVGDEQVEVMFVGGPILLPTGRRIGLVLVGEYVDDVAERMSEASGANITLYDAGLGEPLATSLEGEALGELQLPEVWRTSAFGGADETPVRQISIAGVPYREALTPFEAKGGEVILGITGTSLIDAPLIAPREEGEGGSGRTLQIVVGFGALGLLLIGIAGLIVSHGITQPLVEIANATSQVAIGNLDVEIPERGGGEVTVVARSFNQMVRSLRQLSESGDWGTTASLPPAILGSFEAETGTLMEVEPARIVLLALSLAVEGGEPSSDLQQEARMVEEAFVEVEAALRGHRGKILDFDGDVVTAGFGMPGTQTPLHVAALLAVHAAFQVIEDLAQVDIIWRSGGAPGLSMGAAVHEGSVVLTDVGKEYGLSPAPLGRTVKVTRGLLNPAKQMAGGGILVTQPVFDRLGSVHGQFTFGRSGMASVKEADETIRVHELKDRKIKLVETADDW